MANIKCPVCGYEVQGNNEIMNHMKQVADDQHKDALKKGIGAKGGEAVDATKDKAKDAMSGLKDKM